MVGGQRIRFELERRAGLQLGRRLRAAVSST